MESLMIAWINVAFNSLLILILIYFIWEIRRGVLIDASKSIYNKINNIESDIINLKESIKDRTKLLNEDGQIWTSDISDMRTDIKRIAHTLIKVEGDMDDKEDKTEA